MKLLLVGKNGQVGIELACTLPALGEVIAVGRAEMDLNDESSIRRVIREAKPAVIVNAAAYTAVDLAEAEPEKAHQVNAIAPGVMAEEAARLGATMVHYSTDYVFDGHKHEPYLEDDASAPLNVYGRSKAEGERRVREAAPRHLILRTSWVYGLHGKNFLLTMARLGREREELRVVDDQHGSPTWSGTIASATVTALRGPLDASGTYHLAARGSTTWCEFAREIVAGLELSARVTGITTGEYPTAAQRPAYSVLDTERFQRTFGVELPEWREPLRKVIAQLRNS